jgi:Pyruvate/2-oxoacid:ferredoxin oxidoreductase delta subunit
VAEVSAKQGAEVTLTSVFAVEKMQATRHEVEHALSEGITIRGGLAPVAVLRGADGRATALRVVRCEARMAGGRLEIKNIEGTEEDIPADLIVSAIGQAVDFTGLEEFNNGKGQINSDKNYQVSGHPSVFVGGDVVRPHLLTTAIGHGAIAADGIERFLRQEPLEKRPKIDVHTFDMRRKMIEKGLTITEVHEPIRGTDKSTAAIHNFDNRSDRYVISHKELFLGHFPYVARNRRDMVSLTAEQALDNFEERLRPLLEAQVVAEAKRCMSCGQCFECDNCVVYCPQVAVFKVPKAKATMGRYVDTDYSRCIGCHICADVCPSGYIQMGLGE